MDIIEEVAKLSKVDQSKQITHDLETVFSLPEFVRFWGYFQKRHQLLALEVMRTPLHNKPADHIGVEFAYCRGRADGVQQMIDWVKALMQAVEKGKDVSSEVSDG
jgi:hypothetical protein